MSRFLQIIGLFCRVVFFTKDLYFKEPTNNRSHTNTQYRDKEHTARRFAPQLGQIRSHGPHILRTGFLMTAPNCIHRSEYTNKYPAANRALSPSSLAQRKARNQTEKQARFLKHLVLVETAIRLRAASAPNAGVATLGHVIRAVCMRV